MPTYYSACNEVGARSCFYTCLWFCSHGGCRSLYMLGETPCQSRYPPRADTPTPWEQTPPPGADTPWEIWATSGRYASCWNAYLFCKYFAKNCRKMKEFGAEGWMCAPSLGLAYANICLTSVTCLKCGIRSILCWKSWEYLWSYLTFWVVILDCGLKLHKLSIHTLVILQKWLEIN